MLPPCVVLYLTASPSVLLLWEVWGRRGNDTELSSQDPAPLRALWPGEKHKISVNRWKSLHKWTSTNERLKVWTFIKWILSTSVSNVKQKPSHTVCALAHDLAFSQNSSFIVSSQPYSVFPPSQSPLRSTQELSEVISQLVIVWDTIRLLILAPVSPTQGSDLATSPRCQAEPQSCFQGPGADGLGSCSDCHRLSHFSNYSEPRRQILSVGWKSTIQVKHSPPFTNRGNKLKGIAVKIQPD